jgi:hypothetical protein
MHEGCGRPFTETLRALALRNARALEDKARTASSLAVTYPRHADAFRAIESEALQQIFRIVVRDSRIADPWVASGPGENHSPSIPSSIVYEKERGFRR